MGFLFQLTDYNNHLFSDQEYIKLNRITNIYLLALFAWALVLELCLLVIFAYLLTLDYDRYFHYLYYYLPLALVFIAAPIITFFFRFRWANPIAMVAPQFLISLTCLAAMSVMAGQQTHLYLTTLGLIPIPFYILQNTSKRLKIITWICTAVIVCAEIALVFAGDLSFPLPDYLAEAVTPLVVVVTALIMFQLGFVVQRVEKHYQQMLAAARTETELANRTVRERDERLQRELGFAADVQRSIQPRIFPEDEKFSLHVNSIPYGKVTGDYYDVVNFSGSSFIFLADASGHGVPAALTTIVAQQAFRGALQDNVKPSEILAGINGKIYNSLRAADFVSAFLMRIDPDGVLHFSSAGHPLPILLRRQTMQVTALHTSGVLLGAFANPPRPFMSRKVQLKAGDRIAVFTDGITEQRNIDGDEVGRERLIEWLTKFVDADHAQYHQRVFGAWQDFVGEEPYADDTTLLTLEYRG